MIFPRVQTVSKVKVSFARRFTFSRAPSSVDPHPTPQVSKNHLACYKHIRFLRPQTWTSTHGGSKLSSPCGKRCRKRHRRSSRCQEKRHLTSSRAVSSAFQALPCQFYPPGTAKIVFGGTCNAFKTQRNGAASVRASRGAAQALTWSWSPVMRALLALLAREMDHPQAHRAARVLGRTSTSPCPRFHPQAWMA